MNNKGECKQLDKPKRSFFKNVFPVKGDSFKEALRKIVLLIAVIVFIVSGAMLVNILLIQPNKNKNVYNEIKDIYYSESADNAEDIKKVRENQLIKVRELNPDISGWIKISNTNIDNPVLMPPEEDSEYYLYRNYKKESTKYGSLFLDATVDLDNNYKNMVIYGHHMQDGSMFANLIKYSDLDFYKQNPIINFDTIKNIADWKIISIFKTNTRKEQGDIFQYIQTGFSSDIDFLNYVYNVRERSLIDIPVDVNENDELVTLSTCSYEFDDFRTVVVARKIRELEDSYVDVSNAKLNPDPLMPQIWYDKRGGTKPKISDFSTAYSNGEIDWYIPLD